ncbi:unnamed protein product, partial [marine sediment metagenome]
MKRTKSLEVTPRFLQPEVTASDIDYIKPLLYLIDGAHTSNPG